MLQHTPVDYDLHKSKTENWLPHWPNPADFRFDYFRLMKNAPGGLARLPEKVKARRVAIVGGGVAGMTAARELHRCGFDVSIFEATERIGGRLWTAANPVNQAWTGMELGAMRMPFFPHPGAENCLLEYYLLYEAGLRNNGALHERFPNPGTAGGNTGIYINEGRGPRGKFPRPALIHWPDGREPDNKIIRDLSRKVVRFTRFFTDRIRPIYLKPGGDWSKHWHEIVKHYDPMTFDDLVMAKKVAAPRKGNYGGFGMTEKEAELLYTIGTGDGSWGAFYSIGALWFLRCTLFGFGGEDLRTIIGLGAPEQLPCYARETRDALEQPLPPPYYRGIQSLVEYLYFAPPPTDPDALSLHESPGANLYTRTKVVGITRLGDDIAIAADNNGRLLNLKFDHVFISSGQWASQMSFRFRGFADRQLPTAMLTAQHTQHNISSCKLFFPLKEEYWKKPENRIPQVLVTDTFIQDAYALSWNLENDADPASEQRGAVILASYTWEDDSLKLLPFDEQELASMVLDKLREITVETTGQDITQYINQELPVIIQWLKLPTYDGCAKLYRQNNQTANQLELSYNEKYGRHSHLYFVGENYGVEGGWTEPALRSALDGVMRLLRNVKADFQVDEFEYERDYPSWESPTRKTK